MKQANIPYVLGKTWTTDAIYRETRGNFEKRKQDGCIAVEMECAFVQAVCDFWGVEFYGFLKSGDLLDAPEWDPRSEFGNNGSQHDPRYFMTALDLACFVSIVNALEKHQIKRHRNWKNGQGWIEDSI